MNQKFTVDVNDLQYSDSSVCYILNFTKIIFPMKAFDLYVCKVINGSAHKENALNMKLLSPHFSLYFRELCFLWLIKCSWPYNSTLIFQI